MSIHEVKWRRESHNSLFILRRIRLLSIFKINFSLRCPGRALRGAEPGADFNSRHSCFSRAGLASGWRHSLPDLPSLFIVSRPLSKWLVGEIELCMHYEVSQQSRAVHYSEASTLNQLHFFSLNGLYSRWGMTPLHKTLEMGFFHFDEHPILN